jgi:cytochrome P450
MIAVEQDGGRLTAAALVGTALLPLVAGFETTVNLIGSGQSAAACVTGGWPGPSSR